MSTTYHLVGHKTKTYLWCGQGNDPSRFYLYTAYPEPKEGRQQDQIAAYLAIHLGTPVTMVSSHNEPGDYEYAEVVSRRDAEGNVYFVVDPEEFEYDDPNLMANKLGPDFRLTLPPKEAWKDW